MSSSYTQKQRGKSCLVWVVIPLVVIIGYSAVRNILDWYAYNKGNEAYQQANCAQAIPYFDNVLDAWRLADMGKFAADARFQKEQCVAFQAAVDKQQAGDVQAALLAYMNFMEQYPNRSLSTVARIRLTSMVGSTEPSNLAGEETCGKINVLLKGNLIPQPDTYLPPFYLACGHTYEAVELWQSASTMYKAILIQYPNHVLANEAEKSLIANPFSCEESESLKNTVIAQRYNFMPSLYFQCGQIYEKNMDWGNAIATHEKFLAEFPNHALASDVKARLAKDIVTQSQTNSAGEIPAPERSGSTGNEFTDVVIQNDSPERLRIVFSGPEARIEELEPCTSCTKYTEIGPLFCPEKGPIGRYTLAPGQYDVVVESISDSGVTPWTGKWDLGRGGEYSSCFFIVTSFLQ